jgi:hypothetical protein
MLYFNWNDVTVCYFLISFFMLFNSVSLTTTV